jgi:hypothetical protein
MKKCETCYRKFTPTGRAHRFCTPSCRPSAWLESSRLKYLEQQGGTLKVCGKKPNPDRWAMAHALRATGLTLAAVGLKMGVTRQAVHLMLAKPLPVPCSPSPAGAHP